VPRFVIVAGESSGDLLASKIIDSIKEQSPNATFEGVAGPKMVKAGCTDWFNSSELSVMGIFGVLKHLPRIFLIRRRIIKRILNNPPDAFIGIDSPDFNLTLEKKLKNQGIKTIHVVSPSFWAWRKNRVRFLNQSADLLLCLFPFEEDLLRQHNVKAIFIGHPLADSIDHSIDISSARNALQLDAKTKTVITLMPGSRNTEIKRHAGLLFEAADLISKKYDLVEFVVPVVNDSIEQELKRLLTDRFHNLKVVITGNATLALSACDLVITKSGTATLEAALHKKPVIVVYKMSFITYWFLRIFKIVQTDYISLPNILLGKKVVPELIQENAHPETIFNESMLYLSNKKVVKEVREQFNGLSLELKKNASMLAATAIIDAIDE
jgi:lipid-A-disaccharide synthase